MLGCSIKNALVLCAWIFLFGGAIPRAHSLVSKNWLRIFTLRDSPAISPQLIHLSTRDPCFVHQSRRISDDIPRGILCQNKPGRSPVPFRGYAENIPDPEYNFPQYERKWQRFWDRSKLFQTLDPDDLNNKRSDGSGSFVEGNDFVRNHAAAPKPAAPHQNDAYFLTHSRELALSENESNCPAGSSPEFGTLDLTRDDSAVRAASPLDTTSNELKQGDSPDRTGGYNINGALIGEDMPKYYILAMIPYPSGKGLHVGHLLGYTAVDVIARYKRLNNYNVLNPIGFDCFGIPTEIYSESLNRTPRQVARENVDNFRKQLRSMGFSFDFGREILTCDVDYYRWTQWVFQRMFLSGLAFRDRGYVNFCPGLGSELSNEEVKGGRSVRGGFDVYKRLKEMWKLRITAYAKRLYDDLELVDFPSRLVTLQRNWINPRQGYLVKFPVQGPKGEDEGGERHLFAFLEDLNRCAKVEALEIPVLLEDALDYCSPDMRDQAQSLLELSLKMSNLELSDEKNRKRVFSGLYALNPSNGTKLPVFITNALVNTDGRINCRAVLGDATTGRELTSGEVDANAPPQGLSPDWYQEYLSFNMRDWVFSRNRGWGEPIPILSEEKSGSAQGSKLGMRDLTPQDRLAELPVELHGGVSETMPQWAGSCWHFLRFVDPHNRREIFDRRLAEYWLPVDLYVGGVEHAVSHLLYSRFWTKFLHDINVSPVSEPFKKIILHGMVKTVGFYLPIQEVNMLPRELQESILANDRLQVPGPRETDGAGAGPAPTPNVCGPGTKGADEGVEIPENLVMKYRNKYVLRADRRVEVKVRMKKMSKSRGNVINPEEIIARFGSDALRMHLMFLGPIDRDKIWSAESITGVYRLLRAVNTFCTSYFKGGAESGEETKEGGFRGGGVKGASAEEVIAEVNRFIDNVTANMESFKLNKISEFFSFFRRMQEWRAQGLLTPRVVDVFLVTLSPYAPHLTEELWHLRHRERLARRGLAGSSSGEEIDGEYRSIALEGWPKALNVL